jgi:hypothetical protein
MVMPSHGHLDKSDSMSPKKSSLVQGKLAGFSLVKKAVHTGEHEDCSDCSTCHHASVILSFNKVSLAISFDSIEHQLIAASVRHASLSGPIKPPRA